MVGLAFTGSVSVSTVVAQGCRPVGPPMFVTSCQGNRVLELDGRPPTDVLREVYEGLDPAGITTQEPELEARLDVAHLRVARTRQGVHQPQDSRAKNSIKFTVAPTRQVL